MSRRAFLALALLPALVGAAYAAGYPAPKEGTWTAHDFRFHTGEVLAELKLHYLTVGDPSGEPVLLLHGTAGSAAGLMNPSYAGELFGPGQVLDTSRYYVIVPDAIGAGKSSKPSDGMRAHFPRYDYDDMVSAQYRLVTEGLGIKHLRAVIGNSMGGMHAWLWGEAHPGFMDALVPMASQPTEMASRNWMMRRLLVDSVRNDPAWKGGDYTEQPPMVRIANVWFGVATIGGTLGYQELAPTRVKADELVDARLKQPFTADANDFMYQWDASRDYDAAPGLERIEAAVLAVNSADDERNPPQSGIMERSVARLRNGRLLLIPESPQTRGHGTTGIPRFWSAELRAFLDGVPRRGM